MTERRPHWDDAIFTAVSGVLRDVYDNGYSEEQVYQVIAAVEDDLRRSLGWGNLSIPDLLAAEHRAAGAEATVERIRHLIDDCKHHHLTMVGVWDVEQALGGDA